MNISYLSSLTPVANHLWQSTIFVALIWLITLGLKRNRAAVRYSLWFAASVKFLLPFSSLVAVGSRLGWRTAAPAAQPQWSFVVDNAIQPFAASTAPTDVVSPHASLFTLTPIFIALWVCGVAVGLAFWLKCWMQIRSIRTNATPLSLGLPILVLSSRSRIEPGVIGILRPVLLLPVGIESRLTPDQLDAVLAHEMAHVRRRDNLTAAIHMLVETVFWFFPLVWWLRARLIEEREHACDEAVMRMGSEAEPYAEGIIEVCKSYTESPAACISGISGADLKKRIHRILSGGVSDELKFAKKAALGVFAAAALILPIIIGAINVPVMRAQSASGPLPSFEVASIKPDPDPSHRSGHSIHIHQNNGYYSATGLTAKYLIKDAYNLISDDQLSGGPDWISSEPYAIEAKFDPTHEAKWTYRQKQAQLRLMIQSLLADRFQLKVSHQTRELPVFDLVVAKGGPKIGAPTANGHDQSNDGHNEGNVQIYVLKNEPIQSLIDDLSHEPEIGGRLVIDKTGLTGYYSFGWKWSRQIDNADIGSGASTDPPSLWTALQEQLGLRLESTKGPVDTIVIDHIEKPSPN